MLLNRAVPEADRPVLLSAARSQDSYGDDVDDWSDPLETSLPLGSEVQERTTYADTGNGTKRIAGSELVLVVPGRVVFDGASRVRWRGLVYRMDGRPITRTVLGRPASTVALVRKEGA